MSRRRNGTNRAGAQLNASRFTGYGRPIKKTVSLAELNGQIKKSYYPDYNREKGELQDE